jgi:hypothetical protein
MTHTYALLEVSPWAYDEIKGKLLDAGYQHAIHEIGKIGEIGEIGEIDMHGIALVKRTETMCPFYAQSPSQEEKYFCSEPYGHTTIHLDHRRDPHKPKHWTRMTDGELLDLEG